MINRPRPFQKGEIFKLKEPKHHKEIHYTILDGYWLPKECIKGSNFKNCKEGWRVLVCEGYEWGEPRTMEIMLTKLTRVYE